MASAIAKVVPPEEANEFDHLDDAESARLAAVEALKARIAVEEGAARARDAAEEALQAQLAAEAAAAEARLTAEEAEAARLADEEAAERARLAAEETLAAWRAKLVAEEAQTARARTSREPDPPEPHERFQKPPPFSEAELRAAGLGMNDNSAAEAEDVEAAEIRKPDPPEPEERAPARAASPVAEVQEIPEDPQPEPEVEVPAPKAPEPTCQVSYWRGYRKAAFYARAFDEEGLEVALAESPLFKARGNGVPERTEQAVAAYEALIAQLANDGWEPIGPTDNWFGQTLRRGTAAAE